MQLQTFVRPVDVINTVAQRIGVAPPTEITHVNQRRDPVPYDWSAPLLKTFNAFYAEDFDALGYAKKPLVTV